jgi:hypothetical protein
MLAGQLFRRDDKEAVLIQIPDDQLGERMQ